MIKRAVLSTIRRLGYDLVLFSNAESERQHLDIYERVRPYLLSSYERTYALIDATRYIVRNQIAGAFVECGVFKGGSMMAVALALMAEGVTDRDLYLFDTFAGMPAPDARDVDLRGRPASDAFARHRISDVSSSWMHCSRENVAAAMASTGYPAARIHLVQGTVEQTIPAQAPPAIALLRLDTDWYQSTRHELVHLYPRLTRRGVAIVDDYGHFKGTRDATDEYFRQRGLSPLLQRIDYTARMLLKQDDE
jgi:hypothetical protein